jgi:hypothetical protein
MLSRTAESFFWIGRYVERAEYIARFVNVHYHLLTEIATQRIRLIFGRAIWKIPGNWRPTKLFMVTS